jgi:hypothetical protein
VRRMPSATLAAAPPHPFFCATIPRQDTPSRSPLRWRHESAPLLRFVRFANFDAGEGQSAVARTNVLYLVIGALAIAVVVLGYQVYQDRHQPQGVHIDFGPNGLSINGK